jgi:hypothetical protein
MTMETPAIVEEIAKDLGCLRVNGNGEIVGAAGVLLDGIADGRFMLVLREP